MRSFSIPARRWSFTLFFAGLLGTRVAVAAEPEEPRRAREKVTLTTSAVTPFFGAYLLESKLRMSNTIGMVLIGSYLVLENEDWNAKSGTVGAGVDYYFQGDALRRWYVEAVAELWFTSQRHEPSGEVAPLGLGYAALAVIGYQFVCDWGPVLDLGAGAVLFHLPSAKVEVEGGSVASEAMTRVYPVAKVNLGWAF
jgi:hypothetical protein